MPSEPPLCANCDAPLLACAEGHPAEFPLDGQRMRLHANGALSCPEAPQPPPRLARAQSDPEPRARPSVEECSPHLGGLDAEGNYYRMAPKPPGAPAAKPTPTPKPEPAAKPAAPAEPQPATGGAEP